MSNQRKGKNSQAQGPKKIVIPPQQVQSNNLCTKCKKPNAPNSCSACKKAFYCDQKCQKQDWNTHRPICQETKRLEKERKELLQAVNKGGWFLEEKQAEMARDYQAQCKAICLERDFEEELWPARTLAPHQPWKPQAFGPGTRLGVDPKYREIGKSILAGSYVTPKRPSGKETLLPVDLIALEDELIWGWCFKKALLLAQKNLKPFSSENRILGFPLAEKQVAFGRDDHLALHAVATLVGCEEVMVDYETVLAMNLFAETGSMTEFTELHAMARAGRIASVRFMIEGGMNPLARDSALKLPVNYVDESLSSSDAMHDSDWMDQLMETKSFLTLATRASGLT